MHLFFQTQTAKKILRKKIYYLSGNGTFYIFWDFLVFYQIFLSPQVKQCAIITYKHGIYELPQDLPNDIRPRILGK